MSTIIVIVIALAVATVHLFVSKKPRTRRRVLDVYLLYLLVVGVGIGGLYAATGHLFAADEVAERLGWAVGSPFQTEVGFFNLAFGVMGICCIWFREQWWYAVTVGWTVFAVGAAGVHLHEMTGSANDAALNSASVLPDLLIPALLIVLLVLRARVAKRDAGEPLEAGARV